jgi:hypothetical protein
MSVIRVFEGLEIVQKVKKEEKNACGDLNTHLGCEYRHFTPLWWRKIDVYFKRYLR